MRIYVKHRLVLLSVWAVTLLISRIAQAETAARGQATSIELSKHAAAVGGLTCGPRAAWVLSQFTKRPIDWNEIIAVGQSTKGVSIDWIREFLSAHGIRTEVRRLEPSALRDVKLPLVAFIRPSYSGGLGHFVVVTAVTSEAVEVIDPNIGIRYSWNCRSFLDAWNGHGLVLVDASERPALLLTLGFHVTLALFVGASLMRGQGK